MNKKNIRLMYAISLLHGMVFYGPIATLYRQAAGVSVFQITLIESISYILCILFEVPWGIVADRIGYKKTMIFCCGLYFISKLVFWQAAGFGGFLLERVMLSIVIAGFTGVDSSILYLSCEKEDSQKVFGIYNGLGTVGLVAASLVYSLAVGDNYRAAGFLTVCSYGLAALLSVFLEEVKGEGHCRFQPGAFREILSRTLRNKSLLLFLAAVSFMSQTTQTVVVFLNQIQYQKCGLSPGAIGLIYIPVTLAGTLGIFSGKITRRVGVKYAGMAFFAMAATACLTLGFTGRAFVSVAAILLLNLCHSLFQPLQAKAQNDQVLSENRATELSVYAILIDGICAGTSMLFGAFAKISLEAALFLGAALALCGMILYGIWHKRSN